MKIVVTFARAPRLLACLLLLAGFSATPLARPATISTAEDRLASVTADAGITVQGVATQWRLSLLDQWSMYRIPHTYWVSYRTNFYRFFVLRVQLTNVGQRPTSPYQDLNLILKVMPPHTTAYWSGFSALSRDERVFIVMAQTAANLYHGSVPWVGTKPGHTTTYCYVIATNRGDSHYGLYNAPPLKRDVFLTATKF